MAATEFSKTYEKFIKSLEKVLIDPRYGLANPAGPNLTNTIENVINEASSEYALVVVDFAASQLDSATRERLIDEMKYFQAIEDNKKDPKTGETVKKSLEDLLGNWMPEWLKRALKILNELLKIASGRDTGQA